MRKPTIWLSNRSDTNRAIHAQKQVRSLRSGFKKMNCTICVAKTKALINFEVTSKLVCDFVFAYANCWFSYAAAQRLLSEAVISSQPQHTHVHYQDNLFTVIYLEAKSRKMYPAGTRIEIVCFSVSLMATGF